jgi:protein involved in polysaccharide export with SLBB domain
MDDIASAMKIWSYDLFKSILFAGALFLIGGSAAARPPSNVINSSQTSAALATPLSSAEAATYTLGPGDRLSIITFDEAQLTGNFYVGANGMVSLPWIGDVPAQGRTEGELRLDIEARLKDGYILNPQVSLQVLTFRPFYILGEVNRPGEYPYVSGLTVMSAVATAQGFTYRANKKRVTIKRVGEPSELTLRLSPTTEVRAGDTIRISERYF